MTTHEPTDDAEPASVTVRPARGGAAWRTARPGGGRPGTRPGDHGGVATAESVGAPIAGHEREGGTMGPRTVHGRGNPVPPEYTGRSVEYTGRSVTDGRGTPCDGRGPAGQQQEPPPAYRERYDRRPQGRTGEGREREGGGVVDGGDGGTATLFRVSCADCGPVRLAGQEIRLIVGSGRSGNTYSFRCPQCGTSTRKPAGPRIVELLSEAGVPAVRLLTGAG